ncbi:dihydrofolate reductase family protein [Kutzneria chonburiensis]|uniref:Dihydrofolate reductase family protein n=1 Tax=Kutzneria chonburiensis TaxID=1483604 RepID=A0ABV6MMX6_9PSEU|nr:dihydrofolate reductase family protein [Kutzneria chonburiensis]
MGSIVVFENVSLDGVTQDPTGEDGFTAVDWRDQLSPADREVWAGLVLDDVLGASALLIGRRSYEYFAGRYPARTGPMADRMNSLPKHVVSTTLTDPTWHNSTVLAGDIVPAVTKLKETVDGELRVYASSRLVPLLLAHDLVDEIRLVVFPLAMGAGYSIFDQADARPLHPRLLSLVEARTVGENLLHLTYRRP